MKLHVIFFEILEFIIQGKQVILLLHIILLLFQLLGKFILKIGLSLLAISLFNAKTLIIRSYDELFCLEFKISKCEVFLA